MTEEQRLKNLTVPTGVVDVVIDTDAKNEVDDQFAIGYLLRSTERLNTVALYAAPFSFPNIITPDRGMEESYLEILRLLKLAGEEKPVYRGSTHYMTAPSEPVISDAARDLAGRARNYSPEHPLYVVAIGAITNVASALLLDDAVRENTVVIWLGGHSREFGVTDEYNMRQDVYAARVVMESGVPFIQLPCMGVVSEFAISAPELREYLVGKNPLADYLARTVLDAMSDVRMCWTRVIWDVTAVGWLLNDGERFMRCRIEPTYVPTEKLVYERSATELEQGYVYYINRDRLMTDLLEKLLK